MNSALHTKKGEQVMKRLSFNSVLSSTLLTCGLTLGTLASSTGAFAQAGSTMVRVNIPFAFQVGSQQLPAGRYEIKRESSHLVQLRGPANAAGFVSMNTAIKLHPADHGSVVFHRYGSRYFLSQIWTAGNSDGLECPKTHAEKEALLAVVSQNASPTELALNTEPMR
jgi:hypothetical protein